MTNIDIDLSQVFVMTTLTQEQICSLPTDRLRAIVKTCNPQTVKFANEYAWGKAELKRRADESLRNGTW